MASPLEGEQRLAFAAFRQAVADLIGVLERDGRIGSERFGRSARAALHAEVRRWFFYREPAPYSFELVCEGLEWDATAVRDQIRKYVSGKLGRLSSPGKKLQVPDVVAIRIALSQGVSAAVLARKFGVDRSHVGKIGAGKRCKDVAAHTNGRVKKVSETGSASRETRACFGRRAQGRERLARVVSRAR